MKKLILILAVVFTATFSNAQTGSSLSPVTSIKATPIVVNGVTELQFQWTPGIGQFNTLFLNGIPYFNAQGNTSIYPMAVWGIYAYCYNIQGGISGGSTWNYFVRTYPESPYVNPNAEAKDSEHGTITVPSSMGACASPPLTTTIKKGGVKK